MESLLPASPRGATADVCPGASVSPTDNLAGPASRPECRPAGPTSSPSWAECRTVSSATRSAARENFPNRGQSFLARCSLRKAGRAAGNSRIDVETRSPSRCAFFQGCRERRIAGSTVDELGCGAERDHHAARREANRVLAVGAYLEHAFRFPCAVNSADGGREKDFLRRLDNRGLGELVHRLPIDPATAAPLEEAVAIHCGIGPGPDQLREALGRIYASDFLRLPSGRGRRQG